VGSDGGCLWIAERCRRMLEARCMHLQLQIQASSGRMCHRRLYTILDCIPESYKLTKTRRLLQSKDDLPTKLPALPTEDEVRDAHLPPQW
jgi:hypothetical protein